MNFRLLKLYDIVYRYTTGSDSLFCVLNLYENDNAKQLKS